MPDPMITASQQLSTPLPERIAKIHNETVRLRLDPSPVLRLVGQISGQALKPAEHGKEHRDATRVRVFQEGELAGGGRGCRLCWVVVEGEG